jgi:hypothetical protein
MTTDGPVCQWCGATERLTETKSGAQACADPLACIDRCTTLGIAPLGPTAARDAR